MPIERKLAAIMFTDIAGYTAQMSKDEAVAISLLNKKESVLKPLIAKHNGTYVKSTGDGSLSHFNSAVDAATCAKRFQESIYDDKDLNVRVGVHLGDTIFEKGDIRGDGVNIASRLESMAVEGGVFVSKEVHDQLANQKEFEGISLGLQSMKGVGRLIEVYGLKGDKLSEPNPDDYIDTKIEVHSDDEVPSIAIIPFDNKGAEEDVFYAYGISADLISDCSSAGLIRVASLKMIEELVGLTVEEKAKKLDVRYIAQGTLWKMDDMFQLSVELYDTNTSRVIWSDRWEEDWDNLTTIKGNLSDGLLKALDTKPKIEKKIETTHTEAYEYYLKGRYKYKKRKNIEDIEIARGLLQKSYNLDDNLISARNWEGVSYIYTSDYKKALKILTLALKKSEKIGDKGEICMCLNNIGLVYFTKGDIDRALDYFTRTIEINEELGDKRGMGQNLVNLGSCYYYKNEREKALEYWLSSLELSQKINDKYAIGNSLGNIAQIYVDKEDLDKALDYYIRSLEIQKEFGDKYAIGLSLNNIGITYYYKGDEDKALEYCTSSLNIKEELGDKRGMGYSYATIGAIYFDRGNKQKSLELCEKSISVQMEINHKLDNLLLKASTYMCLAKKHLGKKYEANKICKLIKDRESIDYRTNYSLYQLLDDTSYFETAYNQVQELADNLEPDVAAKFLSYPMPKAIVEEWEKIK